MKKMIMMMTLAIVALALGGCGWTVTGCRQDKCVTVEVPERGDNAPNPCAP